MFLSNERRSDFFDLRTMAILLIRRSLIRWKLLNDENIVFDWFQSTRRERMKAPVYAFLGSPSLKVTTYSKPWQPQPLPSNARGLKTLTSPILQLSPVFRSRPSSSSRPFLFPPFFSSLLPSPLLVSPPPLQHPGYYILSSGPSLE